MSSLHHETKDPSLQPLGGLHEAYSRRLITVATIGSLLSDKAIFIDLFVLLKGWFVCLNLSQNSLSPRTPGDGSLVSPREEEKEG